MRFRAESFLDETMIATAIEVHMDRQIVVATVKSSAVAVLALAGLA